MTAPLERVNFTETNNTKVGKTFNNPLVSAYIGYFKRGQAFKPMYVVDEPDLVQKLGLPVPTGTETNQVDFYTVLDCLKYVAPVLVIRSLKVSSARNSTAFVTSAAVNAGSSSNYVKRLNDDITPTIYNASAYAYETVLYCAYPAVDGDSFKVALHTTPGTASGFGKTFGEIFNGVTLGANEMYLVIGTGSTTILEKFIVSKNVNGKDELGNSIYIDEVLKRSNYIRSKSNPSGAGIIAPFSFAATALAGGNSEPADQVADLATIVSTGLDQLLNKEKFNLHLFIDSYSNVIGLKAKIIDLCGKRGDSAAIVSPPISAAILADNMHTSGDLSTYYNAWIASVDGAIASSAYGSFCASFCNFKIQRDKYNDVYFVNSYAGEVAGSIMASNAVRGVQEAVAGVTNGQVLSDSPTIKTWSADDRIVFAKDRINPIIMMQQFSDFPIIYDYLTMLNEESILNKLHARLIVNKVKKFAWALAKLSLIFNKSSSKVQQTFYDKVEKFMFDMKVDGAVKDYLIQNTTTGTDLENDSVRYTVGMQIPGLIRIIYIDLIAVGETVDLNERLAG